MIYVLLPMVYNPGDGILEVVQKAGDSSRTPGGD
jgi:hypothetical protein